MLWYSINYPFLLTNLLYIFILRIICSITRVVATVIDPNDKKNGLKLPSNDSNDDNSSAYNPSFFTMPFKVFCYSQLSLTHSLNWSLVLGMSC